MGGSVDRGGCSLRARCGNTLVCSGTDIFVECGSGVLWTYISTSLIANRILSLHKFYKRAEIQSQSHKRKVLMYAENPRCAAEVCICNVIMFSLSRSPVSVSGAGAGRELGRGLSRSTTTCSHLAQAARPGHFTSPALSLQPRPRPSIRSRVSALISGAVSPRQCVTPPPGPRQQHCPAPATAPLPKKVRSHGAGAGAGLTCSHSASSGVDHGSSSGLGLARLSQLGIAASVSSSDSLAPAPAAAHQRSYWSENQIRNREFVRQIAASLTPPSDTG